MRRKDREITDPAEIRAFLDGCKVCRVGFFDGDRPYIVPMNLAYELKEGRLTLYFHCAKEGKKLHLIRQNPNVGIELDREIALVEGSAPCQYSYRFMSIIGSGKAGIVEDMEEKAHALTKIMKHQTGRDFDDFEKNPKLTSAVCILRVDVEEYSCKKNA